MMNQSSSDLFNNAISTTSDQVSPFHQLSNNVNRKEIIETKRNDFNECWRIYFLF